MVSTSGPVGVVRQRPDVTILDTRAMRWEDHPGIPGGRWKVLSRDSSGVPLIMLNWLPAKLPSSGPERHYHRSVLEHGFVLAGEFPIREYEGLDDVQGLPVLFRDGYFYRRTPGSMHGRDPVVAADATGIGFLILEWRSGPGTYLWEEGIEAETTSDLLHNAIVDDRPPLEADPRGVVLERDDIRILDTRAMPWEEHPGLATARIKILDRDEAGVPTVMLQWLPADLPVQPNRHYHRTVLERGFVLEGLWPHREYDSVDDEVGVAVPFVKGFFYERQPGSVHGMDPRPQGPGMGFVILEWRSGPGNYDEPGAEGETVRIPLAGFDAASASRQDLQPR